jgi:hypothetical protein
MPNPDQQQPTNKPETPLMGGVENKSEILKKTLEDLFKTLDNANEYNINYKFAALIQKINPPKNSPLDILALYLGNGFPDPSLIKLVEITQQGDTSFYVEDTENREILKNLREFYFSELEKKFGKKINSDYIPNTSVKNTSIESRPTPSIFGDILPIDVDQIKPEQGGKLTHKQMIENYGKVSDMIANTVYNIYQNPRDPSNYEDNSPITITHIRPDYMVLIPRGDDKEYSDYLFIFEVTGSDQQYGIRQIKSSLNYDVFPVSYDTGSSRSHGRLDTQDSIFPNDPQNIEFRKFVNFIKTQGFSITSNLVIGT